MVLFDAPLKVEADALRGEDVISWAAHDGGKPGRSGQQSWVVHASPGYSRGRLELPAETVERELFAELGRALGLTALPAPRWMACHRWRYARVTRALIDLQPGTETLMHPRATLAFAGDYLIGARVEAALLSGLAAARLSSHIEAATYRLLCLIREFDENGGWGFTGARSCAHWLNWRIGWGLPAARERVRVARALGQLPLISEALRKGEISYSKVRAISRIATPENEQTLVSYAYHNTAAQVERVVRLYRNAERSEQAMRDEQRHAGRELRYYTDDDGMFVIRGRLSPELGAAVVQALELAEAQLPPASEDACAETSEGAQPAESSPPASARQRRADALGLLAQAALANELQRGSAADRTQVVLHVDVDEGGQLGTGRFEPDLPIGPEAARRHLCDASVVTMKHGADGALLDVGRKRRTIPPAIRRALQSRDEGCQFPGCSHRRYLDAHHIQHWADGGPTRLDNLVHLCTFHHRLVHEGGFGIEVGAAGDLVFCAPTGQAIPTAPPLPGMDDATAETLEAHNAQHGLTIDDRTLGTWEGYRPDYGWGVEILLDKRPVRA